MITSFRVALATATLTCAVAAFGQSQPAPAAGSPAVSPTAPATTPATAPAAKAAPPAAPAGTTPAPAQDRASRRYAPKDGSGNAKAGAPTGGTAPGAPPTGAAQAPAGTVGKGKAGKGGERGKGDQPLGRALQNAYADLMTPEELAAHRAKVKGVKTYTECRTLFDATAKDMEARAKAQNKAIKATPAELCDRAKERGRVTG